MTETSRRIGRLGALLIARGALLLLAGALAVRWPEAATAPAMTGAALVLVVFGAYEASFALRSRRVVPAWPVGLADGLASLAYGVLTAAVTVVPARATLLLVATWLAFYAVLLFGLALGLWPMRRTRDTLLVVGVSLFLLGVAAVVDHAATIFTLAYAGAAFAAALGAFQVTAGLWMRRVAVPAFSPTIQASWLHARQHTSPPRAAARARERMP